MKIHFFGAARTVTGSQYLFEINGRTLLVECGMYQGKREESYRRNRNFHFDTAHLDAAILSHAHIDHSGNLPNLLKNGYTGPIYCTPATKDLTDLMVRDSGHIQEADAVFVNKKRALRGEPPVEPLYTLADAEKVNAQLVGKNYDEPFEPIPGVTVRLVDAGHILGSAAVVMEIEEPRQPKKTFWFSGDIGRDDMPILRDPVLPHNVDYLMMECTYGDKPHRDPEASFIEFRDVLLRTIERRGKVIIPAFAVGRTQDLVYKLHQMVDQKQIPNIPIYVDSPLASNSTKIYENHTECYDEETCKFILQGKHPALAFDNLHYTQSVEESKALNTRTDSMVIISASGMAEVGRILHHLANNIEDKRNTVMIVGWQAPDTLGRRLADREKQVRIFGDEYQVNAEIATIGGLSAHAGQEMLMKYAECVKGRAKQIILIHGEPIPETALQQRFSDEGLPPVIYPDMYQTMEI
jgi:metallo-beta-lactamase family protein